MRVIKTSKRAIASLSTKAQDGALLLRGPGGARVIVMSLEEFARRQPESVSAAESPRSAREENILYMQDYVSGCK